MRKTVVFCLFKTWCIHIHSALEEQPLAMAAINSNRSNYHSSKRKSMRQKQCRRKTSLMKKACEYSKMCAADVCVGIRLRETGQVHILSADASGFWAFLTSQLGSHYPTPNLITDRDLEKSGEDTNATTEQKTL